MSDRALKDKSNNNITNEAHQKDAPAKSYEKINNDIFLKRYKILEKIGEGSYSEVLRCQNRESGEIVASKRLKRSYRSWNEVDGIAEIETLRTIQKHSNILQMTEIHYDSTLGKVSLVFELMDINLYELIKDRKRVLPESRVRTIMFQLFRALRHLHKLEIFHRDIKPENILIKLKTDQLKLGDLGSVRGTFTRPPYTEYISTRWYRSPECLLTAGHYSYKMDVWAAGCVFYEVLTSRPLFPGSSEIDQINRINSVLGPPPMKLLDTFQKQADMERDTYRTQSQLSRRQQIQRVLDGYSSKYVCANGSKASSRSLRMNKTSNMNFYFTGKEGTGLDKILPGHITREAKEIIKQCLSYDPEQRPTSQRIIQLSYFYELRESYARNPEKVSSKPCITIIDGEPVSTRSRRTSEQLRKDVKSTDGRKSAVRETYTKSLEKVSSKSCVTIDGESLPRSRRTVDQLRKDYKEANKSSEQMKWTVKDSGVKNPAKVSCKTCVTIDGDLATRRKRTADQLRKDYKETGKSTEQMKPIMKDSHAKISEKVSSKHCTTDGETVPRSRRTAEQLRKDYKEITKSTEQMKVAMNESYVRLQEKVPSKHSITIDGETGTRSRRTVDQVGKDYKESGKSTEQMKSTIREIQEKVSSKPCVAVDTESGTRSRRTVDQFRKDYKEGSKSTEVMKPTKREIYAKNPEKVSSKPCVSVCGETVLRIRRTVDQLRKDYKEACKEGMKSTMRESYTNTPEKVSSKSFVSIYGETVPRSRKNPDQLRKDYKEANKSTEGMKPTMREIYTKNAEKVASNHKPYVPIERDSASRSRRAVDQLRKDYKEASKSIEGMKSTTRDIYAKNTDKVVSKPFVSIYGDIVPRSRRTADQLKIDYKEASKRRIGRMKSTMRDDVFCSSDEDVVISMRKKFDNLISERARRLSESLKTNPVGAANKLRKVVDSRSEDDISMSMKRSRHANDTNNNIINNNTEAKPKKYARRELRARMAESLTTNSFLQNWRSRIPEYIGGRDLRLPQRLIENTSNNSGDYVQPTPMLYEKMADVNNIDRKYKQEKPRQYPAPSVLDLRTNTQDQYKQKNNLQYHQRPSSRIYPFSHHDHRGRIYTPVGTKPVYQSPQYGTALHERGLRYSHNTPVPVSGHSNYLQCRNLKENMKKRQR